MNESMMPVASGPSGGGVPAMVVNGRAATPLTGWSILDAARIVGVTIPTLCHHPALPPDGSCRLCVVEIEGRPGLHPACVEPAVDGLRVQTDTAATWAARRHALELLLQRYRRRPGTRDNAVLALARAHDLSADGATPLPLTEVALAVREVPELNTVWRGERAEPSERVHLGVAIALRGGGLVAPALHDADRAPIGQLMQALRDLVQRARSGGLRSSELSDPTITVTSLGEQGVDTAFGIVYPPQVAIVGFGRIGERPLGRRRHHRAPATGERDTFGRPPRQRRPPRRALPLGRRASAAGAGAAVTTDTVRATVLRVLGEIAPEADLTAVRSDVPLREQLDLDSMDVLNFVVGLHTTLGVDIPEADYGKLATLDACISYLAERSAS